MYYRKIIGLYSRSGDYMGMSGMATIMVIEDEAQFRDLITLALELEQHTVEPVISGAAALQLLNSPRAAPLDLITLDLSMPDVSGWDVLDAIVANPALDHVGVIVMTALADEWVRRRASHPRVTRTLIKPLSVEEILAAVNAALGEP